MYRFRGDEKNSEIRNGFDCLDTVEYRSVVQPAGAPADTIDGSFEAGAIEILNDMPCQIGGGIRNANHNQASRIKKLLHLFSPSRYLWTARL